MPGLYGLSSNANVSVYNTTGLYQLSNANVKLGNVSATNSSGLYNTQGNVFVPTNAQALLNLLYNNGNVNFALSPTSTQVQAFAEIDPTKFYGNSNVALFLANFGSNIITTTGAITAGNLITTSGLYWSNGAPFLSSSYGNANVAAYLPIYGGSVLVSNITTVSSNIAIGQNAGGTQGVRSEEHTSELQSH